MIIGCQPDKRNGKYTFPCHRNSRSLKRTPWPTDKQGHPMLTTPARQITSD